MKRIFRTFGIIALAAIIGFGMAACGGGANGGGNGGYNNGGNNNGGNNNGTGNFITSIAVTTNPTQMEYLVTENFNPAGMVITATTVYGTTFMIGANTPGVVMSGFSSDEPGPVIITFSFEGRSTTLTVTILPTVFITIDRDDGVTPVVTRPVRQGHPMASPGYLIRPAFSGPIVEPGLYRGRPGVHPFVFVGWYANNNAWDFANPVNEDMTLIARWRYGYNPIDLSSEGGANIIERSISRIRTHHFISGHTLYLDHDVDLAPQVIDTQNFGFHIIGFGDAERQIRLSENGTLFSIGSTGNVPNIELIIGNNITLVGRNNNNAPLIIVQGREWPASPVGRFTMLEGSKITGNTSTAGSPSHGAAVFVNRSGSFYMRGGEITGNAAESNDRLSTGGVMLHQNGTGQLIMSGNSRIHGNGVHSNVVVPQTSTGGANFRLADNATSESILDFTPRSTHG